MRDDLNYNHLRHFWVVANEGALTRGARRLRLTHSTLSAQLRALEERLGRPLFVRRSRGVALTPFGEEVKTYCDEMFRVAGALQDALAGTVKARRPAVRVGVTPSLPRTLLYRALQSMVGGADPPPVSVTSGDVDAMCGALALGRLHVVLSDRAPRTPVDVHVYAHPLGATPILFFAHEKLARRLREGFPASLDDAPMVLPSPGTTLRDRLTRYFSDHSLRPRIVAEIDDVPLMKTFAAHGRGVVPVRAPLADEARRLYGLHHVGAAEDVTDMLYALTLHQRVRHPDVQRLVAECRRRLA